MTPIEVLEVVEELLVVISVGSSMMPTQTNCDIVTGHVQVLTRLKGYTRGAKALIMRVLCSPQWAVR